MRASALIHRWSSLHVPYRRLVSAKACWLHSPVPARLYNLLHLCFRLFLWHTILIPQDILSPVTGCVPVPLFLSLMYSTLTACLVLFFADFHTTPSPFPYNTLSICIQHLLRFRTAALQLHILQLLSPTNRQCLTPILLSCDSGCPQHIPGPLFSSPLTSSTNAIITTS